MKKLLLVATVFVTSLFSANNIANKNGEEIKSKKYSALSECNTQTTKDADGDDISVTCCRTTYQEAFDCAAKKLRDVAMKPQGIEKSTDVNP